jgi:hypothetical protein
MLTGGIFVWRGDLVLYLGRVGQSGTGAQNIVHSLNMPTYFTDEEVSVELLDAIT